MIGAMKQSMILINKEATKMKLKELKDILKSERGLIQQAIIYDSKKDMDLETGCSIEYAIYHYGEQEITRINSCIENGISYLIITI